MRRRLALIAGIATFLVLAGTGVGYALWSSTAVANGTVKSASLADTCAAPTKLANGGFETPNISPSTLTNLGVTALPGWSVQNDNTIEMWRGYNDTNMPVHPLPAAEGAQFIELNGNAAGTLYQDVATTPGQILRWSVKHHGRWGTDIMKVSINAPGAALVTQSQFSTSNADWRTWDGTYTVPAGQTTTRFSITAVSTATGNDTVGNLVDDVTFGSGPCLTATASIANITTSGATTYKVGDVVEYTTTLTNSGGNHANSSVFTATVPTGLTYVAGSITVDGVAKSDSSGNDQAEISGSTITARLGQGATASAGGAIPPANSVVVKFRATVQSSAAGGNLTYNSSTAYVDALAPLWPLASASPTLTTPIVGAADVAVILQSVPAIGPGTNGQQVNWVMRVINNGPSAATGVAVDWVFPRGNNGVNGAYLMGRGFTVSGSGTCPAITGNGTTTATCTVGNLAAGAYVDITFRGTVPNTNAVTRTVSATASSTSYDPDTSNNSQTSAVAYDGTAPTTPTNLSATRASDTQIDLTWTASTDTGSGIAGYRIYRNGVLITTTTGTGTTFENTGLASNLPYWYWVVAIDNAGNVSGQSVGEGAVTYTEGTSYRLRYANNTLMCLQSPNSSAGQLQLQLCTYTPADTRQWTFTTVSGDNVYIRFQSGTARGWTASTDTSSTNIVMSAGAGDTAARSQWNLGAYWDGTQAHVEIRRTTAMGLCVDVNSAGTTAGTTLWQYTCNQTVAQRFALVQP